MSSKSYLFDFKDEWKTKNINLFIIMRYFTSSFHFRILRKDFLISNNCESSEYEYELGLLKDTVCKLKIKQFFPLVFVY